ncbi:EAL domain-containing protein [Acidovorax kalamii]|uniref:EAL domain-containing protein n=1 Tax=Acidovorax kalamii TaxID=2004485 RepID=UPI0020916A91|nr:EAL domain-containing protein [Acidovorax kalamii]MCO5357945.1 EAL domain-containing protein [Acidovorax kalamii]
MTLPHHPAAPHEAEGRQHAEALLQLCKRLERAWTLPDVLEAVKPMGESVFDYRHVWLALFDEATGMLDFLTHTTSGEESALSRQLQTMKIPVKGDALLEEIMCATHVVVVEDARSDPRTNKAVVAALHNRTIVNVPLVMADQRLGALGMGTYGDEEGVRPPKPWQVALMQATAGHLAVALDRVRFMTARREAEEALVHQKERLQVTLQSISDAVVTTDAAGMVQYLNPAAQALTGWPLAAACGRRHQDVLGLGTEPGTDTAPDLMGRALEQGITQFHAKLRCTPQAGAPLLIDLSASPLLRPGGDADGVVLVFRDVTEASRLSREMEFQALHDTLTSLGNRRAFEHLLAQAFAATRDATARHCVCYLDLDNFKVINDTCGHAAGDELLRQVARLFLAHLQPQDLLCRLGGDEFGILLWQQDLQQALQVAERMQQELAAFRFVWRDHVFSVSVSIGAVMLDATTESVGALLQAADSACYVAKDGGRNRIHVYAENDPALAQRYGVMEWVSRIEDALQHDRFELFGQPIIRLGAAPDSQRRGLHCEILLRMRTADGRLVSPGEFMPAVERYQLAARVDRWVIKKALAWMAEHQEGVELCSINLSGQSVGDAAFLGQVLQAMDQTPVRCDRLCFEITETAAMGDLAAANRFFQALRARGCQFALDDFGSGLSSYAYLRELAVDTLKIDGQFVKNMADDPVSFAMVKSIHEIGCLMGKKTVAEFAESQAIVDLLTGLGVHFAQGYALGRPAPIDELLLETVAH